MQLIDKEGAQAPSVRTFHSADIAMVYIVMACIVLAYIVLSYIVVAYIVKAYMVMTFTLMAYAFMTCMDMAYIVRPACSSKTLRTFRVPSANSNRVLRGRLTMV